ncbi:MAG: glycosyltransferase [Planctomycetota bacterium]|nr:glycosyltransferase [Planctomycetota bacterium]
MTPQTKTLKVLHYLQAVRLEHGGVVRAVLDLGATLAGRGHEVTLVTVDGRDAPPEWSKPTPAGEQRRVPTLVAISRSESLRDQIKPFVEQASLVHLHGPWQRQNLVVAGLARKLGKPYVLTPHGMLDDWSMSQKPIKKRVYHALFAKGLLERAAFIHCTAQAELDQAKRWFGRGRGVVLPYVVNFSAFATLPGPEPARRLFPVIADDRLKLLFLSRLHIKKGVEALIDAAALLKKQGPDFTLVIAGPGDPGYINQLKQRIERLGLAGQTHLVGLVSGVDKTSLYQACDLFVLPTSQENFGLVLVESMACGTPVLTTRGTDIWREIEAGGGIVRDANPATIADAVRELAADRPALAQRGKGAREWVMRYLDVDALLDQYEAFYARALAWKG